jgi:hypothetical protein
VNSDGNITLGNGDGATAARTATRFLQGAPRIAVLYADLDPTAGGTVSYRHDDAQSVTIRWVGVPEWGGHAGNTAQVTLDAQGTVTIEIAGVSGTDYIVGVSQGGAENAASPSNFALLAGAPIVYGSKGAVFDDYASAAFDIAGRALVFRAAP